MQRAAGAADGMSPKPWGGSRRHNVQFRTCSWGTVVPRAAIVSVTPKALAVGDRVRHVPTCGQIRGEIRAIEAGIAWVKLSHAPDLYSSYRLDVLERAT